MMKRAFLLFLMISLLSAVSLALADDEICPNCGDTASDMELVSSTADTHTLECFCGDHHTLAHSWFSWQSDGNGFHTRTCAAGCTQTMPCSGGKATCSSPALCSVCGGAYGSVNPDAHGWDEGVVTVAPTCRSLGAKTYTCQFNEAHIFTEALDPDPNAHFFREGVVVKPATCTHEGVKMYTCLYSAQHTKEEPIPVDPDAHRWDSGTVISVATCTSQGEVLYTCLEDSSHTRTEFTPVDMSKHVWSERFVSRAPTCTRDGLITLVCAYDSTHTGSESIPALGHSYTISIITREPTCTEPGQITYTCVHDSSHTYTEEIPATGHRWGNMEIIQEPTCSAEGLKHYICGYDIDHETTIAIGIDPDAHAYELTDMYVRLPGACTDGQAQVSRCTLCGDETLITITEPASHTYTIWTDESGMHTSVCDVCGKGAVSVACIDGLAPECPVCEHDAFQLLPAGDVHLYNPDSDDAYHGAASAGCGLMQIGLYDRQDDSISPAEKRRALYVHLDASQMADALAGCTDELSRRARAILLSDSLHVVRRDDLVLIRSDDDKLILHVMYHAQGEESDEIFCHIEDNTISFKVRRTHWHGHETTVWFIPEEP